MKLTAIKTYGDPRYPTSEILAQRPELLRVLPRRWHNTPLVLGTLAALLALIEQPTLRADEKSTVHTAPVFVHGSGKGAFGCVAVSPPVFLTEADACEVIEEEARKAGVELSERGHKLSGVEIPITDPFAFLAEEDQRNGKKPAKPTPTFQKGDLPLAGWNSKLRVGYKFLSSKDFEDWEIKDSSVNCSVSEYNLLETAKRLQTGLQKGKETGAVVVFYEPVGKPSESLQRFKMPSDWQSLSKDEKQALEKESIKADEAYWKAYKTSAKKAGAEELRSQVKDFIAWLKAQGVI